MRLATNSHVSERAENASRKPPQSLILVMNLLPFEGPTGEMLFTNGIEENDVVKFGRPGNTDITKPHGRSGVAQWVTFCARSDARWLDHDAVKRGGTLTFMKGRAVSE